jgi:hypothetical protein
MRPVTPAAQFLLDVVEALPVSHTLSFLMFGDGVLPNNRGVYDQSSTESSAKSRLFAPVWCWEEYSRQNE